MVIKAEDLARSRRIIPDIGVWHQCYTVWLSVVLKADPGRLQELLAYGYLITKCSKAFKWPSWVLYDQEFRQSKAGNTTARWDEVDTCLYTQHFSGKSEEVENWCPISARQTMAAEGAQPSSPPRNASRGSLEPPHLAYHPGRQAGEHRCATNSTVSTETAAGGLSALTDMSAPGVGTITQHSAAHSRPWARESEAPRRRQTSRALVSGCRAEGQC